MGYPHTLYIDIDTILWVLLIAPCFFLFIDYWIIKIDRLNQPTKYTERTHSPNSFCPLYMIYTIQGIIHLIPSLKFAYQFIELVRFLYTRWFRALCTKQNYIIVMRFHTGLLYGLLCISSSIHQETCIHTFTIMDNAYDGGSLYSQASSHWNPIWYHLLINLSTSPTLIGARLLRRYHYGNDRRQGVNHAMNQCVVCVWWK